MSELANPNGILKNSEKRFKFQSFNALVERVKVDIVRRSRLVQENPDEHDSFFYEALEKWRDLNTTKHFTEFSREIRPLCRTLPAIVYHKDKIIDIIEKHLKVKDSLALDGLLDLVTKLAKDLEGEFYPYFPRIFQAMLPIVYSRDVRTLENLFNCIAYLFKYLSRQLVPDICDIFPMLSKLLGEDNESKLYIRHFTAEAFAFLIRKTRGKDLAEIIQVILHSLRSDPSVKYTEGLALLFFECAKQVNSQLHSRAEPVYKELLLQTLKEEVKAQDLEDYPIHNLVLKTTILMLHHTEAQHFLPIINIILGQVDVLLKQDELDEKQLSILISILATILTVRKAKRVQDFKPIIDRIQSVSKLLFESREHSYSDYLYTETFRAITGILTFGGLEAITVGGRAIMESVLSFENTTYVYAFFYGLSKLEWNDFSQVMLPYVVRYTAAHIETSPKQTILLLSRLASSGALDIAPGTLLSSVTPDGLLRFPHVEGKSMTECLLDCIQSSYDWKYERERLNSVDLKSDEEDGREVSAIPVIAGVLNILPRVQLSLDAAVKGIMSLINSLTDFLRSEQDRNTVLSTPYILGHRNFALEVLLGYAIEALTRMAWLRSDMDKIAGLHDTLVDDMLKFHGRNEVVLRGVFTYLDNLRSSDRYNDKFTLEHLEKLYPLIKENLNSYHANSRLYTCKILALYDQPLMKKDQRHRDDEPCEIVKMAIIVDEAAIHLNTLREKTNRIQKLAVITSTRRIPDIYHDFTLRFGLGMLTVNLRPLWEDARKLVAASAEVNSETYWNICLEELNKYADEKLLVRDGFSAAALVQHATPLDTSTGRIKKTRNISFICPTLHKYLVVENHALRVMGEEMSKSFALLFITLSDQTNPRMDFWNYYSQVLQSLKLTPSVVQKRAKEIVPVFMDFVEKEYQASDYNDDDQDDEEKTEATENDADAMEICEEKSQLGLLGTARKILKQRMVAWLEMFSTFTQAHGVFRSQDLYNTFLKVLSDTSTQIQTRALDCILAWNDKNVSPYADNLRNLMEEVQYRDELARLLSNSENVVIDPAHREGLMPVVLHLLYGRLAQGASKNGRGGRRIAILSGIARCQVSEVRYFLDLALASFKRIVELPGEKKDDKGNVIEFAFDKRGGEILRTIRRRKQQGVMTMMDDMLKAMATYIIPVLPVLLKVALYIIDSTQPKDNADEEANDLHSSRVRDIRLEGMEFITRTFQLHGDFDMTPYLPVMFASFISPRLPSLVNDTSQNVAGIMKLFGAWAEQRKYLRYFVDYDDRVIPQILNVLTARVIQEESLSMVLDIVETILDHCEAEMDVDGNSSLKDLLLFPHVDLLLENLKYRLTQSKDDANFGSGKYSVREIAIVARIAPYVKNGAQAAVILELLLPNLMKPSRIIPENTKEHILAIWARFINIVPGYTYGSQLYYNYYSIASSLFLSLQSKECRTALLNLFQVFVEIDPDLKQVGSLISKMNAYATERIDERDFESMLDAMNEVADNLYKSLNSHQWLPLIHQFLFNMHDAEELAVRGLATHCMSRFLKAVKERTTEDEDKRKLLNDVNHIVYPAIKRGLTNHAEVVRSEFVNLLHTGVKTFPTLPIFEDLVPLLGNTDEDNFFNNIYHLQIHRRIRSLERLSELASTGVFKLSSINSIFMPIISAFLFESNRIVDHNLITQCIDTMTTLVKQMPWNHYYRVFRYYMDLNAKREDMEKIFVRIIGGILDAFHFDISDVEVSDENAASVMGRQKVVIQYRTTEQITAEITGKQTDEDVEVEEEAQATEKGNKDMKQKIHETVVQRMLPALNKYINDAKTREAIVVRIPIAFGVAKLLRALPEKSMRLNLPGLLISVCQTIRSRAESVREVTRNTLLKINALLGPAYVSFMISELKSALTKGYELYVLGHTVNVLLADTIKRAQVGDLDYCLADIVDILVDDIFGRSGVEKEDDEITSKIKEAKSRKSPTTFENISTVVHFKNVGILLQPFKEILAKTESLKTLRKVDDLLKRISTGLVHNPEFESMEVLNFSYDLITENLADYKPKFHQKTEKSQREKNFEVQIKRLDQVAVDHYRNNAHKFVYFGLSLFLTALKRNKFDPSTDAYRDKLDQFVSAVGNTMYSKQTTNVVVACRIMAVLVKYPLPSVPGAVPLVVKRSFQLIRDSGSTHSPLVQSCFKLLTVCIRDISASQLTEHQLTYLLNAIQPDLEEPERQGTVFGFVRAIIARKFMAPEVYDLMDNVGRIMVTNQSQEIRNQARSVFFLFLVDYPQGRNRLKTQMSFIVKNLEYVHETGRQSIMELLHQIITKFGDEILMEFAESILLGLIMRLINDESTKCREMSSELIKLLFGRLSDEKLSTVYRLLDRWLEQYEKGNLQRAACQIYGLVIDTFGTQAKTQAEMLIPKLAAILEKNKEPQLVGDDGMELDLPWEVCYYSLNTFGKIVKTFPELIYSEEADTIWRNAEDALLYPHAWVRSSTARLYGVYFSNINAEDRSHSGSRCEYLSRETLRTLAYKFSEQLKSVHLTEEQANQLVRNLFFISKCLYYMPKQEDEQNIKDEEEQKRQEQAQDEAEAEMEALEDSMETTEEHQQQEEEEEENEDEENEVSSDARSKLQEAPQKNMLNWLIRRLSYIARGGLIKGGEKSCLMRSSIFKWFAAICNLMQPEELGPYLVPMLLPIYRTVNDEKRTETEYVELRQLGNEVLELMQKKAGPTVYFAAYQGVRKHIQDVRIKRKADRAIQVMNNPQLAAKRKLAKHQRKSRKKAKFSS